MGSPIFRAIIVGSTPTKTSRAEALRLTSSGGSSGTISQPSFCALTTTTPERRRVKTEKDASFIVEGNPHNKNNNNVFCIMSCIGRSRQKRSQSLVRSKKVPRRLEKLARKYHFARRSSVCPSSSRVKGTMATWCDSSRTRQHVLVPSRATAFTSGFAMSFVDRSNTFAAIFCCEPMLVFPKKAITSVARRYNKLTVTVSVHNA